MKTDLSRFAPLGLVISLLAFLTFIVALIVKGLSAANLFILPDPKVLDQTLWVCVGVFIFGFALTALLNPDGTRKFFVGRQIKYGSNALLMLAAFCGILIFVNMLVFQYQSTPWDWTEDKQNTLSPETLNILKALPEPVVVRAYYMAPDETINILLSGFKQNSNGKLTYEVINPQNEPLKAQADGVTRDQTLVVTMGGRKQPVEFASEQELDVAIIKLTNPTQQTVYFLTGHGERDVEGSDDTSLSFVKSLLTNKNYSVKVFSLAGQKTIPADAKTVVIPAPQKPLSQDEVNIIEAYLNNGGAVIVLEEPRQFTKFGDAADPLADLVAKWGITLQDDIVIDSNQSNGYLVAADPQNYARHPITEKLMGYTMGYYTARSMSLSATAPEGITLTPLTQSLANGVWGETDYKSIEDKTPTQDAGDITAPLTLAAAAENANTRGRLVVFGDVDFASNFFNQQGQTLNDILLNSVDWTTQQENLINLTPRNNVKRVFKPADNLTKIANVLTGICVIPLLIIFAGVWAWYSRRRRG